MIPIAIGMGEYQSVARRERQHSSGSLQS